jgi:hypothetical protein
MRADIDGDISAAPPYASVESLVSYAREKEAQLLGLPQPSGPRISVTQTNVSTDRDGRFSFRNLAPGRYLIRAEREGYFGAPAGSGNPGILFTTAANRVLTLLAGQQDPPIAMVLFRGITVSGTVRDPNGLPISGLQVDAFQTAYHNGREMLESVTATDIFNLKRTDDRGQYRLYGLPPGKYRIAATPKRITSPGTPTTYARTFYPNVADARTAQIVELAEGSEVGGIDIVIRPDAVGRVSGQVVSSIAPRNGQNGPASTLYLISAEPTTLTGASGNSVTSSNPSTGKFEIKGILPGEYEIVASAPDAEGRTVWGRTRVSIGTEELTGMTLDIHPGVELKVLLTVDGESPVYRMVPSPAAVERAQMIAAGVPIAPLPMTPVAIPSFPVLLESAEGFTNAPFVPTYTTYEPSGTFVFKNVVEGRYTVNVWQLPANGYVADVRARGRSVFDSGIDINSQTGEVMVSIKTNGGKIQGVVRDSTGTPIPSARVALVPPVSRRQNSQLYKASSSDASGSFSMNRIAPGEYKLFAWETAPDGAWMDKRFLDAYENLGRTKVVGSSTVDTELKLIPAERGRSR